MATVSLRRLTTGYATRNGYVEIEKDLTAELPAGQLICLLGPNGAGKSTLLKTMSGILPPLRGGIMINGYDLRQYSNRELSRLVGVVLTDRPDTVSMTVEQLVGLGRSPYTDFWGRLSGKDRKIVARSMELTGVSAMADRLVSTLSDGECQKVMIAKSLAQETPVILLDEPTAYLDFPSKVELMALLKKLAKEEGKIVFQSTHDVNMALQIADNVWLVDKNIGVETGTPADLARSGALQKYFSGRDIEFNPATGLFDIRVRN